MRSDSCLFMMRRAAQGFGAARYSSRAASNCPCCSHASPTASVSCCLAEGSDMKLLKAPAHTCANQYPALLLCFYVRVCLFAKSCSLSVLHMQFSMLSAAQVCTALTATLLQAAKDTSKSAPTSKPDLVRTVGCDRHSHWCGGRRKAYRSKQQGDGKGAGRGDNQGTWVTHCATAKQAAICLGACDELPQEILLRLKPHTRLDTLFVTLSIRLILCSHIQRTTSTRQRCEWQASVHITGSLARQGD